MAVPTRNQHGTAGLVVVKRPFVDSVAVEREEVAQPGREAATNISGLDLAPDSAPFEVLRRSAGARATDRIEVFAAPQRTSSDEASSLFFVRGIRHLPA